ncbi:MAG: beta-ketoacyl-ACP synthase III [Eubacteriales bacterium]
MISGTGMYVPETVVTNDDLSQLVDTNDEWIRKRVGIRERRIAATETTVDMAYEAAKAALDNAGITSDKLDLILCSTVSGDDISPSLACMVQNRLGASCTAYDINAACSAFLFLLETAAGYFARGKAKHVLVIGAERMSRVVDWNDRGTCVIFGDGAGAAVLSEGDCYLDSVFTVHGGDDVIKIPCYPGMSPFRKDDPAAAMTPYVKMNGQETFKYAVNAIANDVRTLMERNALTFDDIRWIVPHQANYRIIDSAAKRGGIPMEKFYLNIERYGNTSSASIPMALDELNRSGALQRGDRLILTAFGGGLANAACLITW